MPRRKPLSSINAFKVAVRLEAMKALVALVDLKVLLTNEREAKKRREIMMKISSCEDSVMTLVSRPDRDEFRQKLECRELVRKFERDAKTRRDIAKKIRAHEDALTPPAKRAASAPKIAARYGIIVSGCTITTRRSRIVALIRRYDRRFPGFKASELIRKLLKRDWLRTSNSAGEPFELGERTLRRMVDKARKL